MTNWNALYTGVSQAAWGYFLLYFNINLGSINILPDFVGYLLLLSAIRHLREARRDAALLRPLAIVLAVYYGIDWVAVIFGANLDGLLPLAALVISLISLYLHFQLLTDLAALATRYQHEDGLDKRILTLRTIHTVLITVTALTVYISQWLPTGWEYGILPVVLLNSVICLCIMAALFKLRKCFRGETPEGLPL